MMIRLVLRPEKIVFVSRGELTCVEFCCLLVGLADFCVDCPRRLVVIWREEAII
jgi:hypothetical protein